MIKPLSTVSLVGCFKVRQAGSGSNLCACVFHWLGHSKPVGLQPWLNTRHDRTRSHPFVTWPSVKLRGPLFQLALSIPRLETHDMNLEEGSTVGLGLFTRWCHGVRELFYIIGGSLRQVCSEPLQLDPVGMTLVSILGGKTSCLPIKF